MVTKEWLEEHHIEKGMNVKQIAKMVGKSPTSIHKWMKKYGIKNQTPPNRNKKYQYNEDVFEEIDTEEKAYWLGFIVADAYLSTIYKNGAIKQHKLRIVLQRRDRDHLERFKNFLQGNMPIVDFDQRTFGNVYPASRIDVNSTKLCRDLMKLGVTGNKSNKEVMPDLSHDLKLHFIRGFFDGDGSLTIIEQNKWSWATYQQAGSEQILLDIKKVFEQEGVKFPNSYMNVVKGTNILHCSKTENVIKLLKAMYRNSTIYLQRKKKKADAFCLQKI